MSSYQVIARKYRPQKFSDVVGQEHVTQTLANAITSGRVAHAYLFCGPRGTGKTTLARIFAKALNCTGGPKAEFDDADPRVQEITEGRALDVLEIDGASNNGVEQVRELRETARFAPAAAKFKIYIIDEVHMLSTQAFNALLKTLEEPPAHVKFFFATTDPEKVLPTILSRCQRFDLRRIPSALIVKHLGWIARQEAVAIDEPALHAIARGADGGMRDAESTLDQLISFCGQQIVEADVLSMFGLASRSQIFQLAGSVLDGNAAVALRTLDELARGGKDLGRVLGDLLHQFRNLLLFQIGQGDRSLVEVSESEWAALSGQAATIQTEELTRVLEVLSAAEGRQRDSGSKRIFLEVTLVKAIQARKSVSIETVLRELHSLKTTEGPGDLAVPPAIPKAPQTQRPVPADISATVEAPFAPPPPPPQSTESPRRATATTPPPVPTPTAPVRPPATIDPVSLWPDVLGAVGPLLRAGLAETQPLSFEKGVLTLGFPMASESFDYCNSRENARLLGAKFEQVGASGVSIQFVRSERVPFAGPSISPYTPIPVPAIALQPVPKGGSPAPQSSSSAAGAKTPGSAATESKGSKAAPIKLDKAEFMNDPLIQHALEIFKAQIVEVHAPSDLG
ncbi:MAG: DNA polymerase III subunit gamma/tau [Pedosphaera sp.]|nr:DNA polymerase III subunit gamma/tau [Pedosphaera sp.]